MFPTLQDLEVQKQINDERIMKAALRRQIKSQTPPASAMLRARIVRFGVWLERLGCRLQSRFSSPNLDLGSTSMQDAHLQGC